MALQADGRALCQLGRSDEGRRSLRRSDDLGRERRACPAVHRMGVLQRAVSLSWPCRSESRRPVERRGDAVVRLPAGRADVPGSLSRLFGRARMPARCLDRRRLRRSPRLRGAHGARSEVCGPGVLPRGRDVPVDGRSRRRPRGVHTRSSARVLTAARPGAGPTHAGPTGAPPRTRCGSRSGPAPPPRCRGRSCSRRWSRQRSRNGDASAARVAADELTDGGRATAEPLPGRPRPGRRRSSAPRDGRSVPGTAAAARRVPVVPASSASRTSSHGVERRSGWPPGPPVTTIRPSSSSHRRSTASSVWGRGSMPSASGPCSANTGGATPGSPRGRSRCCGSSPRAARTSRSARRCS